MKELKCKNIENKIFAKNTLFKSSVNEGEFCKIVEEMSDIQKLMVRDMKPRTNGIQEIKYKMFKLP